MSIDWGSALGAGIDLLGGGDDGGGAGGLLDGLLGSDGGGIGGLVDNFAGSSGLGDLVGGFMGGDGVGDAVSDLLGGSDVGGAVTNFLGTSGLSSGVSDILGGQGDSPGGWLGGLTESLGVGSVAEVSNFVGHAAGGDFGGIGDLADSLGEAVGVDLGGVATTVGSALGDDGGGWFNALDNVLDSGGDAFGSPGGILSSVAESAGAGPSWLNDIASTAETLGSTGFSGALDLIDETVGGGGIDAESSSLSDAIDFVQDSVTTGGGLGELGDWAGLASEGLGALGLDLPEMGGSSSLLDSVESIVPDSIVPDSIVEDATSAFDHLSDGFGDVVSSGDGAVEFIEELSSGEAGALLDQIVDSDGGSATLDALDGDAAKALLSKLGSGGDTDQVNEDSPEWAAEPVAGLSDDYVADDLGPPDSDIEDPGGLLESDSMPEPVTELGALDDVVEAADEMESSVDDLFEGLE